MKLPSMILSGLATAWLMLGAAQGWACQLVITGARLYPSPSDPLLSNTTIVIDRGRITRIQARGKAPSECERIDASRGVLVAGFWNSHVHLTTPTLLQSAARTDRQLSAELTNMFLRWGFTTVFDLASSTETANALRRRMKRGAVAGPRILTAGDPLYPHKGAPVYVRAAYAEHGLPIPEVASAAEARARVGRQATAGVDGIKLFTGSIIGGADGIVPMDPDTARAAADEAHVWRLPVFAHPTNAAGLRIAIEAGVDALAHAAPLMGRWSPELATDLARRRIALIPTLALFELMPDAATPVSVAQQQVGAMYAAGGDVLFGTDAGFIDEYDTSREVRLLGGALDWRAILDSLTTAPARRLGRSGESGRIAQGATADLVLLDGDPAADISAFSKVLIVVRDGRVIYRR